MKFLISCTCNANPHQWADCFKLARASLSHKSYHSISVDQLMPICTVNSRSTVKGAPYAYQDGKSYAPEDVRRSEALKAAIGLGVFQEYPAVELFDLDSFKVDIFQ